MRARKCLLIVLPLMLASCAGFAGGAAPPSRCTVTERTVTRQVTYEDKRPAQNVSFRQVVMENDYLQVTFLPELGGRIEKVLDKTTGESVFLERPVIWPETKYTAYGSQLGGIEVNFPCFHHGNNFMDRWNWLSRQEADGSATVFVGWTEPDSRQRVVHRLTLRPGEAVLHSRLRFSNLNGRVWGYAPWTNMFFGYDDDLQYVIPTRWVVPHGFNDNNLKLLPWPWPNFDDKSVCFWRNVTDDYNSVFAFGLEEDFHGVYRHKADRGMVRVFDRRQMPGVKLYNIPPARLKDANQKDSPQYLEIWTSPALLHEDPLWWEAWAVREYDETYYPVHGIGGYRQANTRGALNLIRHDGAVELAAYATSPTPGAVIALTGTDGDWWRGAVDLSPEKPFRKTLARAPGREPLTLTVSDARGDLLIQCEDRPDPGPQASVTFTGKPLWQSTPLQTARKAELYHALWRGPTGGYGGFGEKGIAAYRAILKDDPQNVEALLGLARSLMLDAQMRLPGRPGTGTAEEMAKRRAAQLAEALEVLDKAAKAAPADPRAPTLAGLVLLEQGDAARAAEMFKRAAEYAEAQVGLTMALAALGQTKEAAEVARRAAAVYPDSSPVQQVAAGTALLAGDAREAVRRLVLLREKDPLDAVTLKLLALSLRATGDEAGAREVERDIQWLAGQLNEPLRVSEEFRRLGLERLAGAEAP